MTQSLCLIFDENARLRYRIPAGAVSPLPELPPESASSDPSLKNAEQRFLGALPSGDRKHFVRFCAKPLSSQDVSAPCELFSVLGIPPFRYAFCEKNMSGSRILNTVRLAEDVNSFYPMMSPAALQCSCRSGRLTREILLCLGHPSPSALSLTPETVLAMQYFPTVLRSLMEPNRGRGLCDVETITALVAENLRDTPPFRNTTLDVRRTDYIPALRIVKMSAEVYVHLLTSVLTALLSVSADHVIRMEVCIFPEPPDQNLNVKEIGNPLSVDLKITTGLRDPSEYRNDSGQLSSLAVSGSSAETMLSAASVLAAAAGILPSYYIDYAGQSLQLFLTLRSIESADEHRALPEFRFRDPYRLVTLILEEFFDSLGKM